ncbi:MAG: SPOR domain-containing protein [Bacteroidota bacterium]
MKTRIQVRVMIIFFLTLAVSSCRFFEKQQLVSNDVDTLLNYRLERYITEEQHEAEISRIRSEVNLKIDSVKSLLDEDVTFLSNKFHIITGSFTVPSNAEMYANKMKSMGFDGKIIEGHGRFDLVTAKSYNNLRVALNDLEPVRETAGVQAWIYISR